MTLIDKIKNHIYAYRKNKYINTIKQNKLDKIQRAKNTQKDNIDFKNLKVKHIKHEITERCNLKCFMCYRAGIMDSDKQDLPLESIIKIYETQKPTSAVKLSCNEPYMLRYIDDLLLWLDEKEIPVSTCTNATLLTEKHFETFRKMKLKPDFPISIDGLAKSHDKIRGIPGSFDRSMNAIKKLKKENMDISIHTVICDKNFDELPDLLRLSEELEVNWHFNVLMFQLPEEIKKTKEILQDELNWGKDECPLQTTEFPESKEKLLDDAKRGIDILLNEGAKLGVMPKFGNIWTFDDIMGFNKKPEESTCLRFGSGQIRAGTKGEFYHCGMYRRSFGSLITHHASELMQGEDYQKFYKLFQKYGTLPTCRYCHLCTTKKNN
jgi:MoaA/NifB/PqqE/SkfB family radical SAM enzyme